jgi:hypothetical protein
LVKPERGSSLQWTINALGFRSFFGQLQAQLFAFVEGDSAAEPVEAAPHTAESDLSEAIDLQLAALQAIWGERLVVIYRVSIPALGQDAPPIYQDRVLQALEARGIPVINLYPPMLKAFQAHQPPVGFDNSILGEGHLNRVGHQLVATEIVNYLEQIEK